MNVALFFLGCAVGFFVDHALHALGQIAERHNAPSASPGVCRHCGWRDVEPTLKGK